MLDRKGEGTSTAPPNKEKTSRNHEKNAGGTTTKDKAANRPILDIYQNRAEGDEEERKSKQNGLQRGRRSGHGGCHRHIGHLVNA